jgi:ABC-type multidrug transport system ATPase subunit
MSLEIAASGHTLIDLRDVSQQVRTGELILRGISLTIGRGELVAIIGGSGTGKTTLLDTMCGLRPPMAGEVRRDGEQYRHGYVPQDDIIHLSLPLGRTLRYTAELRLPAATTSEHAERAVRDVLGTLELSDRSDGSHRAQVVPGDTTKPAIPRRHRDSNDSRGPDRPAPAAPLRQPTSERC